MPGWKAGSRPDLEDSGLRGPPRNCLAESPLGLVAVEFVSGSLVTGELGAVELTAFSASTPLAWIWLMAFQMVLEETLAMSQGSPQHETLRWDAIAASLEAIYGDLQPQQHFAPPAPTAGSREGTLHGLSIYTAESPAPHWHYVTYGFSELISQETEESENQKVGFEVTFRLLAQPDDPPSRPPRWPVTMIQNLAHYVFQSGNLVTPGHYLDAQGPIAPKSKTQLKALLFTHDEQLPPIQLSFGRIQFVQAVGITADELRAIESWNADGMLGILRRSYPSLVTDLARESVLADQKIAEEVAQRTRAEGSNSLGSFVSHVELIPPDEDEPEETAYHILEIGAVAVPSLQIGLRGRLPFGRNFTLQGQEMSVVLEPLPAEEPPSAEIDDDGSLILGLAAEDALQLADDLAAQAGDYAIPEMPELILRVVPSQIQGPDGHVIRTVG